MPRDAMQKTQLNPVSSARACPDQPAEAAPQDKDKKSVIQELELIKNKLPVDAIEDLHRMIFCNQEKVYCNFNAISWGRILQETAKAVERMTSDERKRGQRQIIELINQWRSMSPKFIKQLNLKCL